MCAYYRLLLVIVTCLGLHTPSKGRIRMEVKINGQSAVLALDTGAERTCLLNTGAKRLGLRFEPPPSNARAAPGRVLPGLTDECDIEMGPTTERSRLPVVAIPGYIKADTDGFLGWDVLRQIVVVIDGPSQKASIRDQLPPAVSQWPSWKIASNASFLIVEVKIAALQDGPGTMMIDTGAADGVKLGSHLWQQWGAAHPDQAATLSAGFYPGAGLIVTEERWAHTLVLGRLTLHDVPIGDYGALVQRAPIAVRTATLGLEALRRITLWIDGQNNKVYLKSHAPPRAPNSYAYNRLGAVFVPNLEKGNELLAHVVSGSPAHRAGIRADDVLLRIDDLDATKWRTDPRVLPLSRFWSQPAGTTLHLGLQRGDRLLNIAVTLEDIFPTHLGK